MVDEQGRRCLESFQLATLPGILARAHGRLLRCANAPDHRTQGGGGLSARERWDPCLDRVQHVIRRWRGLRIERVGARLRRRRFPPHAGHAVGHGSACPTSITRSPGDLRPERVRLRRRQLSTERSSERFERRVGDAPLVGGLLAQKRVEQRKRLRRRDARAQRVDQVGKASRRVGPLPAGRDQRLQLAFCLCGADASGQSDG